MAEYINKAELLHRILNDTHGDVFDAIETIETEPTIDIVYCKDCKHWKDSDGVYRRGYNAESKCRVNCKEVMQGDWFCADGERKEHD